MYSSHVYLFARLAALAALATVQLDVSKHTLLRTISRLNKAVLAFRSCMLLCRYNAAVLIHYKIGFHELAVGFVCGAHPYLFARSNQMLIRLSVNVVQSIGTLANALHGIIVSNAVFYYVIR